VNPAEGQACDFSLLENIARVKLGTRNILIDMIDDEEVFLRASVYSGAQGYLLKQPLRRMWLLPCGRYI
jgi:hypothetical protein